MELFDRIRVNGVHTLAAWLQENSATMGISRNILVDAHASSQHRPAVSVNSVYTEQAIDGGQLNYTFTVQYTGGLDAKFSLLSPQWNPLAADLSASIQQTGVLSIFLNGYQAAAAIGAKSNLTFIVPPEPKPTKVIIVGDNRPTSHVSSAGQQKINELLTPPGISKPQSEGGPPPANLSNFFSEAARRGAGLDGERAARAIIVVAATYRRSFSGVRGHRGLLLWGFSFHRHESSCSLKIGTT